MIKFSKMHGLGNDFMVVNAIDQQITLPQFPITQLAHRYLGIGFDQLLLIEPSKQADFRCRIFNADGSEAEQCGNGLRCVARFILDNKLSLKTTLQIETKAGIFEALIHDHNDIRITMGAPGQIQKAVALQINSHPDPVTLTVLSVGNPHAIMQVDAVTSFPVKKWGAEIEKHNAFPHGANVGFMEIVDKKHIRLRTFERGVGETYACGSNACAAVVAGIVNGVLDQRVKVELAFGDLWIEWHGETQPILMTGPATHIFDGIIDTA